MSAASIRDGLEAIKQRIARVVNMKDDRYQLPSVLKQETVTRDIRELMASVDSHNRPGGMTTMGIRNKVEAIREEWKAFVEGVSTGFVGGMPQRMATECEKIIQHFDGLIRYLGAGGHGLTT